MFIPSTNTDGVRDASYWQKANTQESGQNHLTQGHWGHFMDSEGCYSKHQRARCKLEPALFLNRGQGRADYCEDCKGRWKGGGGKCTDHFFSSAFPGGTVTVKFKHQETCLWWQSSLWRKALKYLYVKGNVLFPWKKWWLWSPQPDTCLYFQGIATTRCHAWVHPHACGLHLCRRGRDHGTHTRKPHALYTRLKFLWRNGWLCPWSAHRTLFNINALFKNASFTSKVARWAALEPTGKLRGPERSSWLPFITHYGWLPRVETSSTSWQRRGVSSSSLVWKLLRSVWPEPPDSWKDTGMMILMYFF